MKISRNGQVSIPAPARSRWNAERVVVVDLGDHVVLRPVHEEPAAELAGKYAHAGPTSDEMRRASRAEDASDDLRGR
ncbi:MAG: AbrB/MazE/SpoVT family DNA-binding domain-containing protein [Actinomycetota bacterium]